MPASKVVKSPTQVGEVFLDAVKAGQILGVSAARIYQCWKLGILPVIKIGRQRRMARSQLDEFIQHGGKGL